MNPNVRARFWLESTLASLCGALAVVTLFWRDWIEALTGFDPDHHSGALEWAIVFGLIAACAAGARAAHTERRRSRAATAVAR